MTNAPDDRVRSLADRIRTYLDRHPSASDTLESVAMWWLADRDGRPPVTDVEAALDRLVEQGIVGRRRNPDGRTLYYRIARRSGTD